MFVGFGKHKKLDVRRLIIEHPDYVAWAFGQQKPKDNLATLVANAKRYIQVMDAKPFVKSCLGTTVADEPCPNPVAFGTAHLGAYGTFGASLFWWCATCDPYKRGAARGRLHQVRTYAEALTIVPLGGGRKADYAGIVKELARGKGMPDRITHPALDAFFGRHEAGGWVGQYVRWDLGRQ